MKAIKTITFLSFIFLFYHGVFGQEPHLSLKNGDQMNNNVFTEEARSYLFLTPMTKPLNPATPANHPILDASWSMLPDYSDEFNSGTLNQTKWQMDYGWGNTHAQHLNYNSNDNPNCSCNLSQLQVNRYAADVPHKNRMNRGNR